MKSPSPLKGISAKSLILFPYLKNNDFLVLDTSWVKWVHLPNRSSPNIYFGTTKRSDEPQWRSIHPSSSVFMVYVRCMRADRNLESTLIFRMLGPPWEVADSSSVEIPFRTPKRRKNWLSITSIYDFMCRTAIKLKTSHSI